MPLTAETDRGGQDWSERTETVTAHDYYSCKQSRGPESSINPAESREGAASRADEPRLASPRPTRTRCSSPDPTSQLKLHSTTTATTRQLAAPVLRRFPLQPSGQCGAAVPPRSESSDAAAILALFAPPNLPRAERSLTGLAVEVRREFAEAQRMRGWGR